MDEKYPLYSINPFGPKRHLWRRIENPEDFWKIKLSVTLLAF